MANCQLNQFTPSAFPVAWWTYLVTSLVVNDGASDGLISHDFPAISPNGEPVGGSFPCMKEFEARWSVLWRANRSNSSSPASLLMCDDVRMWTAGYQGETIQIHQVFSVGESPKCELFASYVYVILFLQSKSTPCQNKKYQTHSNSFQYM